MPEPCDFVIAADGGLARLKDSGIIPNLMIGDMDSAGVTAENIKSVKLSAEKDETDTLAAVKYGKIMGYKDFRVYCGTGGRLSHTLANIAVLKSLADCGLSGYIYGKNETLTVIRDGELVLDKTEGYISVFCLGGIAKGVTLEGLKYPLRDYAMTDAYPIGVSNEFVEGYAKISVKSGCLLIIYGEKESTIN